MYALSTPAALRRAGACAVALILLALLLCVPTARADFGIAPGSFSTTLSTTQAGAAVDLETDFTMATKSDGTADGSLKDVTLDLPPGLIGDPTSVPRCPVSKLTQNACPVESQVGWIYVLVNYYGSPTEANPATPIYNMVPDKGETAELAAVLWAPTVTMKIHVRADGDYGLTTEIRDNSDWLPVYSTQVKLWGVPADPSHDGERGSCLGTPWPTDMCLTTAPRRAFLRNPSQCGAQEPSKLAVTSWQNPGTVVHASDDTPEITGCDKLPSVNPTASVRPTDTSAGVPAGYDVDLRIPQVESPYAVAMPPLHKVVIDFPAGTAISPGSVDGLAACSDEQLHADSRLTAVACPAASKIGTVSIDTPYLPDPLEGSMFLGAPRPGDQFRLFLVAEGSGVSIRLKGSAVPDAQTGRLRAVFDGLPQIAFSHLHVRLKGGPRAVLVNPLSCGTATATTTVTPYGGGADAASANSFDIGGDCAARGFAPELAAGTTNPVAGADTPFVLQIRRGDDQQDLKSIAVDLPAGLIGKVAGIPLCPTAAAVAGSCSDASRVGSVSTTVGTGSNPISLPGRVYLTEGYGGPFGLVFVVPAKIGPFDFGTVVVRAKVQVDPLTGALGVQTDDMPSIIAGIPLHYRAITVTLDRAGFMRNPTSCAQQQVAGSLTSSTGAVARPATPFAVAGCGDLVLAPKVKMTFNGAKERKRNGRPGFSFLLTQTSGQSNLRSVAVTLPGDVGLSLGLPDPCTVEQFKARACPAAAKVGFSAVTTPLLDGHLEGGVYLVAADKTGGLPRLGVLLDGQVPISLLSTVKVAKGHVTTTFAAPDLPISTFKLSLNPKTALTAAKDLCGRKQNVAVAILGASGARRRSTLTVPVQGCSATKHKSGKK